MPKYEISRAYVTRYSWKVEAESEAEALKMLEDDTVTQFDAGDEVWQGCAVGYRLEELEDTCVKIKGKNEP